MQEQLPRNGVKTHHYGEFVMGLRVAPTHSTEGIKVFCRAQRSDRLQKNRNIIYTNHCSH